ncbi:MAG: GNAT family N-acetyltransferase [Planctomycetes bacterium]|nr:GNAT family N-acetyltransferase [Planctomycetota bacterium]
MKTTNKLDVTKADATTGENLDEFIKLTEEYFRENWPENLEGHSDWRTHYKSWLKTRAKEGGRRLWTIKVGGKLAGLANFYSSGPEGARVGHISEFYVKPDFRRRGIGRDLFYMIRHELEKDGCRILKSEVQPDEPGRISFWEELGFEVVKVQMALNLAADEEE